MTNIQLLNYNLSNLLHIIMFDTFCMFYSLFVIKYNLTICKFYTVDSFRSYFILRKV